MNKNYLEQGILLLSILLLGACNTDNESATIESDVISGTNYIIKTTEIPLEINSIKQDAVQSNNLYLYQLGQITQGELGTTNTGIVSQISLPTLSPTFGELTQTNEDNTSNASFYNEDEKVEKVYLYLPFFSKENAELEKTSIFGSKTANFKINVNELDYNLREVNSNFEQQRYFSDQPAPLGEVLVANANAQINTDKIIRYHFDNPTTSDDESKTEKDQLAPGIRIELDNVDFFQKHLIVNEGKNLLSSQAEFVKICKGIVISATDFSQDVLTLINLNKAKIEVVYSYTYKDKEGKIFQKKASTELALGATQSAKGIAFAQYNYTNEHLSASNDDIYIKGGRYLAELTIDANEIKKLTAQKMIINHAYLNFYINEARISAEDLVRQPTYLLVFNTETGKMLADYTNELIIDNKIQKSVQALQKDKDGKMYYQVQVTDHFIDVIRGKSNNVKLGVVASFDNQGTAVITSQYKNNNKTSNAILGNSENALFTIIHGNGTQTPEKYKLKLHLTYSLTKEK